MDTNRDSRFTTYETHEALPLNDGTGLWALHRVETLEMRIDPRLVVDRTGRLTWTQGGIPEWRLVGETVRRCGPAVAEAAARDKALRMHETALARIEAYLDSVPDGALAGGRA